MIKDFYQAIGVKNLRQIILTPGRLYFGLNLLFVKIFDRFHGTDFSGGKRGRLLQSEIGTTKERANDYTPTPRSLIATLKLLDICKDDKILDMGCGKGLAMYYMSKFPFNKIGGIELSRNLCKHAKRNLKKVTGTHSNFEIICSDAGKWNGYDEYNYFYIYNSFPRQVIKEVINKITISIENKPRKVIILYLYPEYADEFRKNKEFILVKKGTKKEIRYGMHIYINRKYKNEKIFKN